MKTPESRRPSPPSCLLACGGLSWSSSQGGQHKDQGRRGTRPPTQSRPPASGRLLRAAAPARIPTSRAGGSPCSASSPAPVVSCRAELWREPRCPSADADREDVVRVRSGGDSNVRMNACVCIDTDGPGEVGGQFWTQPVVFCEQRPSQGARLLDSSVWPRGVAVTARKLVFCGWSTFLPFGGGPPARRSGRHRRNLLRTFSRGHVVSLLSAFASSVQLGRCFHLGSESASTCSSEAGRCLPLLAARPALPHGPSLLSRIGPLRSGAADTRWPSHDHGVSRLLAPGLPLLPSVATIDDVSDH
ncbi:uncharacterized protein LOC131820307 isoform X6 [Mustela lutreola]|uniref:uncharacterized protein LOC131820307 isoform X6 n=1 Tax=Mustela lutreola TaxID=9666 RepID=UPI002796EA07|nr:uncharacterized protein LOC131820307 isoform X6 [Mustela lutreola]XP_059011802.1 uncharacterized protein LOC131820307 isoform X6 [Mustela lutreola]XP_059011803.1 uncharacterized protein LOC131820307 isoform X6 [Mustela lutreola]XP_059011804.1 uncharacterized protein LOC131820307 isoform X6 [Mustela lutreola]